MNRNKVFTGLFVVLILFFIVYFLMFRSPEKSQSSSNDSPLNTVSEETTSTGVTTSASDTIDPTISPEVQKAVSPEFLLWFRTEIVKTESQALDPEKLELELKEKAQGLKPFEIQYLKEKILSKTAEAREKILSIYVLSLAGQISESSLLEVASAPLQFAEAQAPHSPEEALAMQEKSLRRLAIESLLESARQDPLLKKTLFDEFEKIPDPQLRQFALDQLQQIK